MGAYNNGRRLNVCMFHLRLTVVMTDNTGWCVCEVTVISGESVVGGPDERFGIQPVDDDQLKLHVNPLCLCFVLHWVKWQQTKGFPKLWLKALNGSQTGFCRSLNEICFYCPFWDVIFCKLTVALSWVLSCILDLRLVNILTEFVIPEYFYQMNIQYDVENLIGHLWQQQPRPFLFCYCLNRWLDWYLPSLPLWLSLTSDSSNKLSHNRFQSSRTRSVLCCAVSWRPTTCLV